MAHEHGTFDGIAYELRSGAAGAPSLLLIHGLGDSRQTWREAFAQVSFSGYTLCAVDLPGFGESPARRPFTFDACASGLSGLMDAALTPPYIVVGHSLGGAVATLVAERRDVHGLVLVEANMTSAPEDSIAATAARSLAAGTFSRWFEDFREAVAEETASASMRRYRRSLERADIESFGQAAAEIVEYSQGDGNGERYLHLDMPRLYVAGRGVLPVTFEFLERNGLDVLRFPQAGHAVMVDESPGFYAALDDWIRTKALRPRPTQDAAGHDQG